MDNYRKGHARRINSKNFYRPITDCDYEYLDDDFIKVTGEFVDYPGNGTSHYFKTTVILPVKSIEFIQLDVEKLRVETDN